MVLAKFNAAVIHLLNEHTEEVLQMVEDTFREKFDFDEEEIRTVTTELKQSLKIKGGNAPKTEKPKRAPTAYNIYIREKMAEIKASNPTMKGKELMAAATAEWTKEHPKEPKAPKA